MVRCECYITIVLHISVLNLKTKKHVHISVGEKIYFDYKSFSLKSVKISNIKYICVIHSWAFITKHNKKHLKILLPLEFK